MNNFIKTINNEETCTLASQNFPNTADDVNALKASACTKDADMMQLVNTSNESHAEEVLDVSQEDISISSDTDEADLEDDFPEGYDDDEFPEGYDDDCQYFNEEDDDGFDFVIRDDFDVSTSVN